MKKKLELQTTNLWDYPSQQYLKSEEEKHKFYAGATPSYIIRNLLNRYTKEKDLIVDPMAGSGTTIDVSRELNRRVLGYDINPLALKRKDIFVNNSTFELELLKSGYATLFEQIFQKYLSVDQMNNVKTKIEIQDFEPLLFYIEQIGKGRFAQELSLLISSSNIIPQYIESALIKIKKKVVGYDN